MFLANYTFYKMLAWFKVNCQELLDNISLVALYEHVPNTSPCLLKLEIGE